MTRSPRIGDVSEVIWEPQFIRHEQAYLSNYARSENSSYMACTELTCWIYVSILEKYLYWVSNFISVPENYL